VETSLGGDCGDLGGVSDVDPSSFWDLG